VSDAASSHWGYGEWRLRWRRAVLALEWRSVRPLPASAVRQRALDRA